MRRGEKYVGLTVDTKSTTKALSRKIADALYGYDQEKGVLKRLGARKDHPLIQALKNLPQAQWGDPTAVLNCLLAVNPNLDKASEDDKKHASYQVFLAVVNCVKDIVSKSAYEGEYKDLFEHISVQDLLQIHQSFEKVGLVDPVYVRNICRNLNGMGVHGAKRIIMLAQVLVTMYAALEKLKLGNTHNFGKLIELYPINCAEHIKQIEELTAFLTRLENLGGLTQEIFDAIFSISGTGKRIGQSAEHLRATELLASVKLLTLSNIASFVICDAVSVPVVFEQDETPAALHKKVSYASTGVAEVLLLLRSAKLLTQKNIDTLLFFPHVFPDTSKTGFINLFGAHPDRIKFVGVAVALRCLSEMNLLTQKNFDIVMQHLNRMSFIEKIFVVLNQSSLLTQSNFARIYCETRVGNFSFDDFAYFVCKLQHLTIARKLQRSHLTQNILNALWDFFAGKSNTFLQQVICSDTFFEHIGSAELKTLLSHLKDHAFQEVVLMKVFSDPKLFARLSRYNFEEFKTLCASVKFSDKNEPYAAIIQNSKCHADAHDAIRLLKAEEGVHATAQALARHGLFTGTQQLDFEYGKLVSTAPKKLEEAQDLTQHIARFLGDRPAHKSRQPEGTQKKPTPKK